MNNRLFEYINRCTECTLKTRKCFRCKNTFCKNHIYRFLKLLQIYPEKRELFKELFNFYINDEDVCASCFITILKNFTNGLKEQIFWDFDQENWIAETRPIWLHQRIRCHFKDLWDHYKNFKMKL